MVADMRRLEAQPHAAGGRRAAGIDEYTGHPAARGIVGFEQHDRERYLGLVVAGQQTAEQGGDFSGVNLAG